MQLLLAIYCEACYQEDRFYEELSDRAAYYNIYNQILYKIFNRAQDNAKKRRTWWQS